MSPSFNIYSIGYTMQQYEHVVVHQATQSAPSAEALDTGDVVQCVRVPIKGNYQVLTTYYDVQ